MRWTKSLIATLRDDPQDAEIDSHKLMVRAGLVRKLSGGLYTFMPLGLRVLHKVEAIVRDEMNRAGAQEILMPALQPAELWERSGRLSTMGPGMFRLTDRQDHPMALGPTHEEVVTELLANEVASYRQLPCIVYQIQTKFRDEIRPRFGLMRAKEFLMKDAYSFDTSMDAADTSYKTMYDAYTRIFARCGLKAYPVEADTGDIGGKFSHEFHVLAASGEDGIAFCPACGYAANLEKAERAIAPRDDAACPAYETVATPNARTIDEVAAFFHLPATAFVKTLVYVADGKPMLFCIPGDRELNEVKAKHLVNAKTFELADSDTVQAVTGAPVGFAGPINPAKAVPIYADQALRGARGMIVGANTDGAHINNVDLARDCTITAYADLVIAANGDICPRCGKSMELKRGIEVGHVFKLGTKYTEAFQAKFLTATGSSDTMVMGCYGIGVSRTVQAIIEQSHDKDGIIWPVSVAPFAVTLLLLDPKDAEVTAIADTLTAELEASGLDVLVDDREDRPGVKFKDADLIGCPIRVVVGAKGLAKGGIEIKTRTAKDITIVPVADALAAITTLAKTLAC